MHITEDKNKVDNICFDLSSELFTILEKYRLPMPRKKRKIIRIKGKL